MPDYKTRLEDEHQSLAFRLKRLDEFIMLNPIFKDLSVEEQADLSLQRTVMIEYEKILWRRLQRIK